MFANVTIAVVAFDDVGMPLNEYPRPLLLLDCIRESTIDTEAAAAERLNHENLGASPTDPPSRRELRGRRFGETSPRRQRRGRFVETSARIVIEALKRFRVLQQADDRRYGSVGLYFPSRGIECRCRRSRNADAQGCP